MVRVFAFVLYSRVMLVAKSLKLRMAIKRTVRWGEFKVESPKLIVPPGPQCGAGMTT